MRETSIPAPTQCGQQVQNDFDIEEHAIDDTANLSATIVGAGITGITAAILLPKKVPGIQLVVYERGDVL